LGQLFFLNSDQKAIEQKYGDAVRIFDEFDKARSRYLMSVVIAGAGFTGIGLTTYSVLTDTEKNALLNSLKDYKSLSAGKALSSDDPVIHPFIEKALEAQAPREKKQDIDIVDGFYKADRISAVSKKIDATAIKTQVMSEVQSRIDHIYDPMLGLSAAFGLMAIGAVWQARVHRSLARCVREKNITSGEAVSGTPQISQ